MRKRLLCAALALTMLFSAQSAAAAAETGNLRSMTIKTKTRMPTISVTVPGSAWVFLNPYHLDVEIDAEETDEQIVCPPCGIVSESDIPLKVDVTVTGELYEGCDMVLYTSSTKGSTSKTKRAFVYFEMQRSPTDDPDDVVWDDEYDKSKHIVVKESPVSKKDILTLEAMTLDGDVADGGAAAFRLTGDVIMYPTKPWTEQDGLNVEVVFTFTPVPYC